MSAKVEDLKLKTKVISGLDKNIVKIVNAHGIAKATSVMTQKEPFLLDLLL